MQHVKLVSAAANITEVTWVRVPRVEPMKLSPGSQMTLLSHKKESVTRIWSPCFFMILIQQYKLFIWFRFCKVIHMCKKLRGVNDTAELKMIYVIFSKIFHSVKRDSFNHFSWLKLIWVRDSWAKSFYEEAISAVSLTPLSQALQCQWHRWISLLGVRYLCHDLRQVLSIPNC